jgi:hypothetical protein
MVLEGKLTHLATMQTTTNEVVMADEDSSCEGRKGTRVRQHRVNMLRDSPLPWPSR